MPFWKQSDDPWDRSPDRRVPEPKEPRESPIDSLKAWNEERKAKAKEKEEARRLPPEKCPWCGAEMEQGFILAGRDPVRWHPGVYRFDLFRGLDGDTINICHEGGAFSGYYKTAWICRACGRMVLNLPESERIYDFPETQDTETEDRDVQDRADNGAGS